MKPKDLQPPPKSENNAPILIDGVFYSQDLSTVPYDLDWKSASIEFCSGNGGWIIERALLEPDRFFIAVEKRFDRVRKIWAKMKNRGVKNLLIVCGEGYAFIKRFVPDGGVEDVYINFPDPWPKRKHERNRLMQASFLDELARVMRGSLTLATDDATYMEHSLKFLEEHPDFEGGTRKIEEYGESYFDSLWREKGKEIFYATYGRCFAPDQKSLQRPRAELSYS